MKQVHPCPECGSERTVPVWEDTKHYREADDPEPDHIGCRDCDKMHSV